MTLLVIDNFYPNPDLVRDFALSQEFNLTGAFPAVRGGYYLPDQTVEKIQKLIKPMSGEIVMWTGDYGVFQLCTAFDRSWIHADNRKTDPQDLQIWAGVVYLTPDAPLTAGTKFYRHKETQLPVKSFYFQSVVKEDQYKKEVYDFTKWEEVDTVANVYNRAIFYRGDRFHIANHYFGHTKEDARLTQTFFFFTEY